MQTFDGKFLINETCMKFWWAIFNKLIVNFIGETLRENFRKRKYWLSINFSSLKFYNIIMVLEYRYGLTEHPCTMLSCDTCLLCLVLCWHISCWSNCSQSSIMWWEDKRTITAVKGAFNTILWNFVKATAVWDTYLCARKFVCWS